MTNKTKKQSIVDIIEELMLDGREWTIPQVRDELIKRNRFHLDGTVSRRMRELRERGYELTHRHEDGRRTTYYKIKKIKVTTVFLGKSHMFNFGFIGKAIRTLKFKDGSKITYNEADLVLPKD